MLIIGQNAEIWILLRPLGIVTLCIVCCQGQLVLQYLLLVLDDKEALEFFRLLFCTGFLSLLFLWTLSL